jgi:hypothetical protein
MRSRVGTIGAALICASCATSRSTDPARSRAEFLGDFSTISVGMAEGDVERVLAHYMKGSNWVPPPEMTSTWEFRIAGSPNVYQARVNEGQVELVGCTIYRHSDDGAYDSDWGIVCFSAGRVSSSEFSPD